MKDLDRIRKLAGILTESVMAVPAIGNPESDMQTAATAVDNSADAAANAASPQLTESSSEYEMTINNPAFNAEDDNSPEEIDVTVYYSVSGSYVPARIRYDDYDHPAEYPDLDIESVVDENGNDISKLIDDATAKYIEEQLWDHINSQEPDYDEPDYDDRDDFYESAPPGMEDMVLKLKKQYPGNEEKAFATAWSIYNKKHGKTEESADMEECSIYENDDQTTNAMNRFVELTNNWVEPEEALDIVIRELDEAGTEADVIDSIVDAIKAEYGEDVSEPGDNMSDSEADADALASAGFGTDEDYGDYGSDDMYEEVTEDYDLNNGYDDIKFIKAGDFFPDGADSPVTDKTGTSGARQGDNPEQKKVAVAETHKELVYNYRKFLKESAKK